MNSSSLRAALASLPPDPTPADLAPIASELARACLERVQPRKSLALYLRNSRGVVAPGVLEMLSGQVISLLSQVDTPPVAATPPVSAPWSDITEAAAALRTQRKTLLERVKQVRYRRLYGWPFWDGHQWWFATAALDPATHAVHMAVVPANEPEAHVAMLPEWCEREAEHSSE